MSLGFSGNIVGDMWTFLLAKFSTIYKGFVVNQVQVSRKSCTETQRMLKFMPARVTTERMREAAV